MYEGIHQLDGLLYVYNENFIATFFPLNAQANDKKMQVFFSVDKI